MGSHRNDPFYDRHRPRHDNILQDAIPRKCFGRQEDGAYSGKVTHRTGLKLDTSVEMGGPAPT